jgi:hypothetical protein
MDFGSELSPGSKGMAINGDWVTWKCDSTGDPHHDEICEFYYHRMEPELTACLWFDNTLSIFSPYDLFDHRTQYPISQVRMASKMSLKLRIDAESGGNVFEGSLSQYRVAEENNSTQEDEYENENVHLIAWVLKNCRFASRLLGTLPYTSSR